MKSAAAALWLSCAFLCGAQDSNPEPVKRLQSVTWDLATHKLVWLVEKGNVVNGEFIPTSKVKYEVSPDEAFMAFNGEQRSFGLPEAVALHKVLDTLSLYCVESVVWWNKQEKDTDPSTNSPELLTKPERPQPSQPKTKPVLPPETRPVKVGLAENRPLRLGPF